MPFPTVKSSPYGLPRRAQIQHLWTEREWRRRVLQALLSVIDVDLREQIRDAMTFSFSDAEAGLAQ